jgi:hypothetical protein
VYKIYITKLLSKEPHPFQSVIKCDFPGSEVIKTIDYVEQWKITIHVLTLHRRSKMLAARECAVRHDAAISSNTDLHTHTSRICIFI